MKKDKIFGFFTLLLFVLILPSCKLSSSYQKRISFLRLNTYISTYEHITLTAYADEIENPNICDGYPSKRNFYLNFTLFDKIDKNAHYLIEVFLDGKSYKGEFTFSPASTFSTLKLQVESLPLNDFSVSLFSNGKNYSLKLCPIRSTDTMELSDLLSTLSKNDQKIKTLLKDKEGEIRIKLISDGKFDFYKIDFIFPDKTYSYFVDGETAEIISE